MAFALQLWRGWGGASVTQSLNNLTQTGLALAGGGAALAAGVRSRGRLRRSWLLLGAGLVSWGAGQAVWTSYELSGTDTPFPSLADVGYLRLPAAGYLGPVGLPHTGRRGALAPARGARRLAS